jgi:hypothetical protein
VTGVSCRIPTKCGGVFQTLFLESQCVGFGVEDNSKIEGCTLKLFVFDNLIVGRRRFETWKSNNKKC